MNFSSNKERGNAGLAMAIAYFGSNGYTVSVPLNDTQDYDLIVDNGNKLFKVQVKATSQKAPSGKRIVSLKSAGGTSGTIYKRVVDTNIDLIFILCEDMTMYLIPKDCISHRSSITLGTKKGKNAKGDMQDTSVYQVFM